MGKTKLLISRYHEDTSWVKDYDFDYLIYNKGEPIEGDDNVMEIENIGNNQRDIFKFIVDNYEDLPETMIFVQGYPYDHCKKETFDKLINNKTLTALEDLSDIPINNAQKLDESGGYMEYNNSWYVRSHNARYNQTCLFATFDEFMSSLFTNYQRTEWNRFTPGSQYIITKDIAEHYSKNFWITLKNMLGKNNTTEGHLIERALWKIFQCDLEPLEELLKNYE